MPNAKHIDISKLGKPKFMIIGAPGSGKTSQICTLPGRTFAYLFDPAALRTLAGQDIDYEEYIPTMLDLSASSLSKGKKDPTTSKIVDAADIYIKWEIDFDKKVEEGFFTDYDNIVIDSFTTFSDVVMDRILKLNGRAGQFPQQDDWAAQMNTIKNVVRTLTGQQNMVLICTAHDQVKQDGDTKRIINQIMLTGQLRTKLPLLFSDIYHLECKSTEKIISYVAQTRPDRMNPSVRCSFRDLDMFHDITIQDWKNPQNYGLGKLLSDHGIVATSAS